MAALLKDRKGLTALLDGILKLGWTPKSGILLSPSSALVNYIAHEPLQGEHRSFAKFFSHSEVISLPPLDKASAVFYSPSRSRRLVVREKEDKTQVIIELWDADRLYQAKEMKSVHQNFINTSVFGAVAWSGNEEQVAYIAERKETKAVSFWADEESERAGEQFLYKENFGEQYEDVSNPGLFVMDTRTASVREIDVPKDCVPAQPTFNPSRDELVFVGFAAGLYRRGIAAMTNRECHLYVHNLATSSTEALSTAYKSCLYPVFSPSGRLLAFYGLPPVLSHTSCSALSLLDWESKQSRTLLDVRREPDENFSGIYGYHETMMKLAWLSESKLLFQSVNKCNSGVFTVETESGNISEVDFGLQRPWSGEVLDVFRGHALLKCSCFTTFPKIFLADLTAEPQLRVLDSHELPATLTDIQQQVVAALRATQVACIAHKSSVSHSTLYWTTRDRPLAVMIHGGPHGNGVADYTAEGATLTTLGFNVLVVNYRGSTGIGEDALQALLGHIGEMDVEDVCDAIRCAGETVSTETVVSIGGSHGGYLSAHMAATGLVKAAVVKNGVIDLAAMNLVTDITDWPSAEVLNTETSHPATAEDIRRMYEASPLSRAGKISVPVLIVAGGVDKRVPSFQSVELFRVLKARGQDVKMLWYPKDGHALMTPATGYDYLLNEVIWLVAKLGSK